MSEVLIVFLTVAAIMALSFLGDAISRRILLPNVILLIATGIVAGPVLNLFNRGSLIDVVPFLAPLTIAFIGFDAGLHMQVREVVAQSRRALLLSIMGFLFSTTSIGVFLHFVLGLRWAHAFLLSSAWGGVSTATVSAVCKHLRTSEETSTTLTVSSLIDDPIVLISTLTIFSYLTLGGMDVHEISLALVRNVAISLFLGAMLGIAWLNVLYHTRKGKYTYTFTLAALLLVYSITEIMGGTGGIAIFLFGLILGNSKSIADFLRMRIDSSQLLVMKSQIEEFHSELTFILGTFFFTFIGLLYEFTGALPLLLGLAISLLLHATRLASVRIGTAGSSLGADFPAIGLIVGKGVASAAMSALFYTLPNVSQTQANLLANIALNVILLTNIISILLPLWVSRVARRQVTSTRH